MVAAARKGILVYDLADPKAPKLTTSAPGNHDTYKVFVSGGTAWGADREKGIFSFGI